MKKIIVTVFFLCISIPVFAQWPEEWTALDTGMQLGLTGIALVDTFQTWCALNHGGFRETNPVLGSHPTDFELFSISGSAMIVHAWISYLLPQPWRFLWQIVWITVETYCVVGNWQIGARFQY